MADVTPTLSDLLNTAIEFHTQDVHVALPCKVEAYDATAQTADVKPQIKVPLRKRDGTFTHESLPVIPNVPVAWPRANSWFVSMPLAAGDFVFVICSERSLETWRATGVESEPGDLRMHRLDGAVALPVGLYPSSDPIANAHTSKMVVGKDDGAKIYIDSDQINLYEESASQFVALAQKTFDEINAVRNTLDTLVTTYNAHTHSGVTTGPGSSGPTSAPATGPAAVQSVAASKVKAT